MQTTVFLVRHGVTDWHREGKLLGTRDVGLNAEGINQAHAAAKALRGLEIREVLSSPMNRAVQTAEILAGQFDIEVARDPRLADLNVGRWEGLPLSEIAASEEYKRFLEDPLTQQIPGGENLEAARARAVRSIDQALSDNASGSSILVVSHASIVRILLAHYLGMKLANYHRLSVRPGSVSILRFSSDRELPRVLGVNLSGEVAPLV